ncbi:hypothetical protein BSL78_15134 [Apostichopus japonicus]|uniref:DNA polymerase theta n=1 Tax=Stichopus japonicus TaxID=307972 RepID=A0A2G8KJ14_STIJA|nr:hypothetical protein BSL78_15134 [Apostichopus japonicus]
MKKCSAVLVFLLKRSDIRRAGYRRGRIQTGPHPYLNSDLDPLLGVNLPARRVIIRTIMFNRRVIDPLCYRQMAGRAGRKGVDTEGESILVCKPNEMEKAKALISSDLPPVQSCLIQREGDELSNSMKRAILEVIASGVAKSPTDVQRYSSSTLLAASLSSEDGDNPDGKATSSSSIDACISFLREQEFIRLEKGEDGGETFLPTQLGSATLASALSPHEALAVFTELQRARKSFVLENELHILYQVTPIYDNIKPDWYQFLCFWETLSTDKRRVAELVGVEERFLIRAAKGNIPTHTARQHHLLSVHRRFHTALILEELVNEAPLNQVARKYGCSKGQLQSLQQSASTFAGMVTVFCSKLGWYNLELLLAQFQNRLNFGVQRELVDLVRISLLNAQRARLLYNSGLTNPASVATASPREVERILRNAVPFKSGRQAVDEKDFEAAERRAARCIWASGKKGLTEAEAAELIVMEAKQIVRAD